MNPQNPQTPNAELVIKSDDIDPQYLITHKKFLWLCIVSFGFYQIWWTYKVYRFFDQKEGKARNSAILAIFSVFYLIPLLYKIRNFAKQAGYAHTFYPVPLYLLFFFFSLLSLLPLSPLFLFSYLNCIFLIQPLMAFNYAIEQSTTLHVDEQAGLNKRQLLLVIFGSIIWFLLLVGFLLTFIGFRQQA